MRTSYINGIKIEYNCVYAIKKSIGGSIGVHLQLQVFKDGVQMDKKDFGGYIQEKIEDDIRDSF